MGLRTLLVIIAVVAIVWIVRFMARNGRRQVDTDAPKPVQQVVRCAHCGVHVPVDEAVSGGGEWYCSKAHRALGPKGDDE
jgi:uncharacterized protein